MDEQALQLENLLDIVSRMHLGSNRHSSIFPGTTIRNACSSEVTDAASIADRRPDNSEHRYIRHCYSYRVGLGLPILETKLNGESIGDKVKAMILPSIIIGVVASAIVVAIDVYGFGPVLRAELGDKAQALNLQTSQPAAWKGLLASFYGGIDEEVLLRLCVMSVLVWLGKFVSKTAEGKPTIAVFWTANILAAVLFGLGHLPATSVLLPLTPLVITRAIVLNGLVGVCTGYLYTKYGLESAMLSHFSADIVLHVLLAL